MLQQVYRSANIKILSMLLTQGTLNLNSGNLGCEFKVKKFVVLLSKHIS